MNISNCKSLPELFLKKSEENSDKIQLVRKLTKKNKNFNYQAKYRFKNKTFKIETLRKNLEYLKLKKRLNINWKAATVTHNKSITNIDSDSKTSF